VVVETECGGASYRGRVAMATAHWPRGGDERSVCVCVWGGVGINDDRKCWRWLVVVVGEEEGEGVSLHDDCDW
jgi:hypothetical protein